MWIISKIFLQLTFFDSVCFGSDIRARQLERSNEGLQGQCYCVERLSYSGSAYLNVEAVEIFSCYPFAISTEAQVRTEYA